MTLLRRMFSSRRKPTIPSAASSPPPEGENVRQLRLYAERARKAGFDKPVLFLSFDCDTDEDAEAARVVEPELRALGIRATYAVPGAQLERAALTYAALHRDGAHFINHGGRAHAARGGVRYVPITFYDKMTPDEVRADMRLGHEIFTRILGVPPTGFRAPHFGSIQTEEQLAIVHEAAQALGYAYCSTTIPQAALDHGPVIERGSLCEIPLFGSLRAPTTLLDSWTYLEDRKDYRLSPTYFDLFRETVDFMQENDLPGVLAYYADPSHVLDQKPFIDAMRFAAARGIASLTADDIVAKFRARDRSCAAS